MFELNIPVCSDNFTGRTREIKKLDEYFDTQKVMIIAGITGIGKTSLILKLISRLKERIDTPFFYINAEKEWNINTFIFEINRWLLDSSIKSFDDLFNNDKIKIREKLDKLVNILENNGINLIIDNFHSIENEDTVFFVKKIIRYFNKARLIICTRKRVGLSPIERVDVFERRLDGLNFDDSKAFIGKLFKRHDIEVPDEELLKRTYEKVNGHPFSIKLIAGLFINGDISVDSFLEDNEEFGEEIESYMLDSLNRSLSKEEKEFLKYFSVFDIPVSQKTILNILEDFDFKKIKKSLSDLYLLEKNSESKFFVHNILKNYYFTILSEDEKIRIYKKAGDYFALSEDLSDKIQAFNYLYYLPEKDKAVKYLISFMDQLLRQGRNVELFDIIEKILEKTGKKHEILMVFKAKILLRWGRLKECIEYIGSFFDDLNDKKLIADVYVISGVAYSLFSQTEKSLEYLEKAEKIYQKIEYDNGIVIVNIAKGDCYRFMNNFIKAKEFFEVAHSYNNNLDVELEARVCKGFGDVDFGLRNYSRAYNYFQKAIKLFENINENFYVGKIKHNLAFLFFETGETEKCIKTLKELLEYRKSINDRVGLVYNASFLGEIYLMKFDLEQAEKYFIYGMEFIIENEEKRGQLDLYLNVIKLNIIKKEFKTAKHLLKDALNVIESIKGYEIMYSMLEFTGLLINVLEDKKIKEEKLDELVEIFKDCLEYPYVVQTLYLKKMYCVKNSKMFTMENELNEYIEKLNNIEHEFYKRFLSIENDDKEMYVIQDVNGLREISSTDYRTIREQHSKYDIYIDLAENFIFESKKKEIKILNKRTISSLFIYLVKNAGTELSFKNIFESIWKREFDPSTDSITVRVNISRLRSLVEPDPKKPKYIINAKESGYYLFNPKSRYIFIMKK